MKATRQQVLEGNKMRPAIYDEKNLIDFNRKKVWMHGVERIKYPVSGFTLFLIVCASISLYFLTRGMWS